MIIDCHSHAWNYWPYLPEPPDAKSRGGVEMLLHEMDTVGVDKAILVCARIDHNSDNNEYVAECVQRYPSRFIQFADVDCSWTDTYHIPGGAKRLAETVEKYRTKGFTHYLKNDINWLESKEGLKFFDKAAELNQIASLALNPSWMPSLRKLALQFPTIPFMCHHMAGLTADEPLPKPMLKEVIKSSEITNIYIKLSGFQYVSNNYWEYPYTDCNSVVHQLFKNFGPRRLCWASNYPPVSLATTYRQSLEAVRKHCASFIGENMDLILGGNMERLLQNAG
tara:strand:- start:101980 stop:102819 length:840 start_codon:yes stop_codon:yes gene_type:complete